MLQNRTFRLLVLLLGLWLVLDFACHLAAEAFWFHELHYLQVLSRRLLTQAILWAIAAGVSLLFLLTHLRRAEQLRYPDGQGNSPATFDSQPAWELRQPLSVQLKALTGKPLNRPVSHPASRPISFRLLFPLSLGLSLLSSWILLHYGQAVASLWQRELTLPDISPPPPPPFLPSLLTNQQWLLSVGTEVSASLKFGLWLGIAIALLCLPRFFLTAAAIGLSLVFGLLFSEQWNRVLLFLHPASFGVKDPLFHWDISFYVFTLPIAELLEFWLTGLFLYGFAAVFLIYLLSDDSLSQGRFQGFSFQQERHLQTLGGFLMLTVAWSCWLKRYQLLYSTQGVVYGAGYADSAVTLPAYTGLSLLAIAAAVFLFWQALFRSAKPRRAIPPIYFFYAGSLYLLLAIFSTSVLPAIVQRLVVLPNELAREQPYLQHNIAFTRQGFGLADIESQTFNPNYQLTERDLRENDLTIRNIRLWDTRPLLQTNRQLQQIRLYYKFPDADIDRYTLLRENQVRSSSNPSRHNSEKQQVLIAARELDYTAVPTEAQTWVNEHLVYTHGYGFTLSPVNRVATGGLPDYFVKDIGVGSVADSDSALSTADQRIRNSIPVEHPRIYYGEITNTYVMAPTRGKELDYPRGNDNAYNTYDGQGGIAIGAYWRRLLFSWYLKDGQMLLTENFTPQTRLLFRRNINERIRAIAPFLRYDQDPYLVTADVSQATSNQPAGQASTNYLYWIVDAYTTSDRYPYSDPGSSRSGSDKFNYIRNSVKVVIDAYNGSVAFYVADPQDPMIASWTAIFPEMFKPISAMPAALRSHIRYPVDLFNLQSQQLLTYHMTDPQIFYNREDQWQIPTEIYGNQPQLVEPYFLITKLPQEKTEEFILLLPFNPSQRSNLIAWLAARSDGVHYGKLLLYQFPKQQLVYGPEQIEARINQDPVISQQISLWNRQGSRVIQGNLLVIPIAQSLLYVEPLYLEAEQNSLPTLVRVVVAYENRIVMAERLEQALQAIFRPERPQAPAIVRPVE